MPPIIIRYRRDCSTRSPKAVQVPSAAEKVEKARILLSDADSMHPK